MRWRCGAKARRSTKERVERQSDQHRPANNNDDADPALGYWILPRMPHDRSVRPRWHNHGIIELHTGIIVSNGGQEVNAAWCLAMIPARAYGS